MQKHKHHNNMKSILQFAAGVALGAVAAPLVVTGRTTQGIAKGVVKTGSVLNTFGESTELKGLTFGKNSSIKIEDAKSQLYKSREQKKADRIAAKAKSKADTIARREQRIRDLQVAAVMREQLNKLDVTQLAQLSRQEFEAVGMPFPGQA